MANKESNKGGLRNRRIIIAPVPKAKPISLPANKKIILKTIVQSVKFDIGKKTNNNDDDGYYE
ncbi:MAG: hypothetical protein WCR54_04365 [Clostridia bacterium]